MLQVVRNLKLKKISNNNREHLLYYLNRYGLKQNARSLLLFAIVLMVIGAFLQVIVPVKSFQTELLAIGVTKLENANQQIGDSNVKIKMDHEIGSGLFKPSRRVHANSITDKTVEKIFESLKLQCVMPMGEQKVAYIVLKDGQMRKCKIGDSIKDMFTVIDIQTGGVVIDILGHKLTLNR